MRLIAKKPCNFGGKKFFIDDEIPVELVSDVRLQEKYGVIAILNADNEEVSGEESGTFFSREQVDSMIADALAEAEQRHADEIHEIEQGVVEFKEMEPVDYERTITISIKGENDGDGEPFTGVPVTTGEIQQIFSIMQLNADEGSKAIMEVKSDNVLILLHATDSRKTIKEAAKKQADNLYSVSGEKNVASNGNEATGTNKEGVDT